MSYLTPEQISLRKDNLYNMQTSNIVLITVDSLRADHLSYQDYSRETTGNVDYFSQNNTCFHWAYSTSSHTPESVPSIITGQYPDVFSDNEYKMVGEGIASRLPDEFNTGGFHSNIHVSRVYGYDNGFDKFDDDLYFSRNKFAAYIQRFFNKFVSNRETYYARADTINDRSLNWIDTLDHSEPFFAWNHYMDVHVPYDPPEPYRELFHDNSVSTSESEALFKRSMSDPDSITQEERQTLIDLYDAEIRYIDTMIQDYLDELRSRDLLNNSLVIITSDHGEGFGEQGYYNHPRYLHDELIHVPLIVSGPCFDSADIEVPVSTLDIAPTILETVGESTEDLPGTPLQNIGADPSAYDDRVVFSQARGESDELGVRRFAARSKDETRFLECQIDAYNVNPPDDTPIAIALAEHAETRLNCEPLDDRPDAESEDTVDDREIEKRLEALGYKE